MPRTPDEWICSQHIDIWTTAYERIDEPVLAHLAASLTDDERDQAQRFHFCADRKRYVVTRALVRSTLSRYASRRPDEWQFSRNAYGRPEIKDNDGCAAGLRFSISHTEGLIVLGVTRHRDLGVDVERLRVRQSTLDMAERFFSPTEFAELARTPSAERPQRFFEYWTLKESYIKARGMGLSLPLDQFWFRFPSPHTLCAGFDPGLGDDASRWAFWQFRPTKEHLLAVCAERVNGDVPGIFIWSALPDAPAERLALSPLRVSA